MYCPSALFPRAFYPFWRGFVHTLSFQEFRNFQELPKSCCLGQLLVIFDGANSNKDGVVTSSLKADVKEDLKKSNVESTVTGQTQPQVEEKPPIAEFEPTAASFMESYTQLLAGLFNYDACNDANDLSFVSRLTSIARGTPAIPIESLQVCSTNDKAISEWNCGFCLGSPLSYMHISLSH